MWQQCRGKASSFIIVPISPADNSVVRWRDGSGTDMMAAWYAAETVARYATSRFTRYNSTCPIRRSRAPNLKGDDMSFTRPKSTDYHSYLLRMWRDGHQQPWRASMQC